MRREGAGSKHLGECLIEDMEPARVRPERGHDDAIPIGGEAAANNCMPAPRDARGRVQVSGDFTHAAGRLVPKYDRPEREHVCERAPDSRGRIGVVIASDPDPLAPALEGQQLIAITPREARRSTAVMKAVANP